MPPQASQHHLKNASYFSQELRRARLFCGSRCGSVRAPPRSRAPGRLHRGPRGRGSPRTGGAEWGPARGSLTMLTSETTSMLAISIRMPTSTGGPAGGAGGGVSAPGGTGERVGGPRAPHLRSQGGGGCRSLGAACPRSPSRRTCCRARRRCGKKHKRV